MRTLQMRSLWSKTNSLFVAYRSIPAEKKYGGNKDQGRLYGWLIFKRIPTQIYDASEYSCFIWGRLWFKVAPLTVITYATFWFHGYQQEYFLQVLTESKLYFLKIQNTVLKYNESSHALQA